MKKSLLPYLILITLLSSSSAAWAVGIGAYGTGGISFMNWMSGLSKHYGSRDYFYGGGLIVDSTTAKDQLLGYRFSIGYEKYFMFTQHVDSTSTLSKGIDRFSMSHTMGLGIIRQQNVRLWIGPQIGLHYLHTWYNCYDDSFYLFSNNLVRINPFTAFKKIQFKVIGLDILLAVGLNINIGNYMTLFIETGFGYMGNFNVTNLSSRYISGHAFGIEGKAGIMFRIDDTFKAKNLKQEG